MTVGELHTHERVELKNRQPVSRTTIHGWPSVLFGLPFAGVGTVVLLLWSGKIQVDPGKLHGPKWIIGMFGLTFLMAGLAFIWHGLDGMRRKARISQARANRESSPWLWDYEWQALGFTDNKMKEAIRGFIVLIAFAAFLAPFNWWAFFSDEGEAMVKGMVIIFDLIFGLAGGYYFIHNLALYLKYGNSRLRFNEFPFFLGGKLSVVLPDLPSDIHELQLDLRFVEEVYETRRRGNKNESRVVCYQLFHESRILKGNKISPSGSFFLEWNLPNESRWTTILSKRPACFWELEVKADTPGVDYHSRFLLPVYLRG